MNTDLLISIVIPTYNRRKKLQNCISSLAKQDISSSQYQIIIIDDASADTTSDFLDTLASDQRYVILRNQTRQGHAICRNKGFHRAHGQYIISTDDDCVFPSHWLSSFIDLFQRHPDIPAIGGSIVNITDSPYGWAEYLLTFSPWFPSQKKRFMKNIPTCNIAYRKNAVAGLTFEIDSINKSYRDTLFNYNLTKAGKKILFDPALKIQHTHARSLYNLIKKQRRFVYGFCDRGYRFHGLYGRCVLYMPVLILLHLFLVYLRCLNDPHLRSKYHQAFPLMFTCLNYRRKKITAYQRQHFVPANNSR
jgi:glycosyltransferase involved in cell wall biosynthesis